jgi:hypothetical protein
VREADRQAVRAELDDGQTKIIDLSREEGREGKSNYPLLM